MSVLIVIPQAFQQFSEHPDLLAYDKLLSLLQAPAGPGPALLGRRLIAGQGLDEMQVEHACQLGTSRGLHHEFAHWRWARNTACADQALCHKRRPENVLIAVPEQQPDGSYLSELRLHARNELMLDHLTGQHIQGMVLTEACRQMFLAVTQRYCLAQHASAKPYFVISAMNMRYQAFAFPLPAQICYRVLDQQQARPERVSIHAEMDVVQAGQVVAGMEVRFTVFDDAYISEREHRLAAQAVGHYVQRLRSELVANGDKQPLESASPGPHKALSAA